MRISFFLFRYLILGTFLMSTLLSCKQEKEREEADISGIELQMNIRRFDEDFFRMRNTSVREEMILLKEKHPRFFNDFMSNILGVDVLDTRMSTQLKTAKQVRKFLDDYRPLYESMKATYPNLDNLETEFTKAFKYLKFYFPNYPTPQLVSFVAPIDAMFQSSFGFTPDIISDSTVGISLLLHAGKDFKTLDGKKILRGVFDDYILDKFTPQTIVSSCMKNVVEDIFPDNSADKTLIEQMVEKGKRYYVLKKILPHTDDSLLFTYTSAQMAGCLANEAGIWKTLKTLDVLYKKDGQIVRTYLGDAPFTPTLSRESPGNIGAWIGYQIVTSYMNKHRSVDIAQLMSLEAQTIFLSAKYKPKNRKIKTTKAVETNDDEDENAH